MSLQLEMMCFHSGYHALTAQVVSISTNVYFYSKQFPSLHILCTHKHILYCLNGIPALRLMESSESGFVHYSEESGI